MITEVQKILVTKVAKENIDRIAGSVLKYMGDRYKWTVDVQWPRDYSRDIPADPDRVLYFPVIITQIIDGKPYPGGYMDVPMTVEELGERNCKIRLGKFKAAV